MSLGRTIDKATIDSQLPSFNNQLNALFNQIQLFAAALDALADSYFTTTLGYTAGELTTLRSAYRDLDKFRKVYTGAMYVTFGASLNAGVPTLNDATHFGYPFNLFVSSISGIGY